MTRFRFFPRLVTLGSPSAQVRMAQGPGDAGFKVGHRGTRSLYAAKSAGNPIPSGEVLPEETCGDLVTAATSDGAIAEVTVAEGEHGSGEPEQAGGETVVATGAGP